VRQRASVSARLDASRTRGVVGRRLTAGGASRLAVAGGGADRPPESLPFPLDAVSDGRP